MDASEKTLLRAGWIAPMDHPPIRDGAVLFSGGKILEVADAASLSRSHPDAEQRDLGQSLILPGLINTHVHLELTDIERLSPSRWIESLADWLIEVIKRSPKPGDGSRVRSAVEAGVEQCLRFGVTTVGDVTRQPALTRAALQKFPLNVVSFGELQAMAGRRHLFGERFFAAVDRTYETSNLRIGISPHAPYSVEPAAYARCVESRLPLATHLAESADETTFLADHTGPFRRLWEFLHAWDDNVPRSTGGPIRFAKSLGLLNSRSVLAHVNYCDDEELQLLANGDASVVYCPRTHAYFGHPPHRWRDMLGAGVNVAIGTDSAASSPDLNLVDDLRLLRKIAPDVKAGELWKLVTMNAARALQCEAAAGTLSSGKRANFVCFPVAGDDPLGAVLDESIFPTQTWIAGRRAFPADGRGLL